MTDSGICIRSLQQRIHFLFFEIGKSFSDHALGRNGTQASGPFNVLGTVVLNEPREGVDSEKTLVSGTHRAVPLLLKMQQKCFHTFRWSGHRSRDHLDAYAYLPRRSATARILSRGNCAAYGSRGFFLSSCIPVGNGVSKV